MKKLIFGLVFLFLFTIFSHPTYAETPDYVIENFKSVIEIQKDTSLLITETLDVNFSAQKHGILRIIPYIYSANGQTINARMEVLSVTDEREKPYQYQESVLNQSRKLQIGDPDVLVNGDKTYIIKYRMENIILKYNGKPEVYWNVTGHEWDTNITGAEAEVVSDYADITQVKCYQGDIGSKDECPGSFSVKNALFKTKSPLLPGQDFTIVVGLSDVNGLIFPSSLVRAADNWGYILALLPLLVMFLLWYWKGRDKKYVGDNIYYKPDKPLEENTPLFTRKFIPMVYSPIKSLTPSEVGTIIDEKIDIRDIVAEIVELARLGFMKIVKTKDKKLFSEAEYDFVKLKNWQDSNALADYQKTILDKIFSLSKSDKVSLSSLKTKFYQILPSLKSKVYKSLVAKGVFSGNPDIVRKLWLVLHIVFSFFVGFLVFGYSVGTLNFGPCLVSVLSFFMGIPLALSMPRKSAWGYSLNRQIVGLREYIRVGKWREEYKEKKLFIDEMLPLAIALGVVDKLTSDMKELEIEPPAYFSGDILIFNHLASSALVSVPAGKSWSGSSSWSGGSGFSGGGSSGGGFGGGGGGSW